MIAVCLMSLAVSFPPPAAMSLPYHEKSDSEKDRLYKNIATQLDRIATDVEITYASQLKHGQL